MKAALRYLAEAWSRVPRPDLAAALILALFAVAVQLGASAVVPAWQMSHGSSENLWFDADCARVFSNMTDPESNHYRSKVHPLFSLLICPPTLLLVRGFGLEPVFACRLVMALTGALWVSAFYAVLRLIRCQRLDACLFSVLAVASGGFLFWFAVPETYGFGSLSILLMLLVVALFESRRRSEVPYAVACGLTLAFTTTNWMCGLLALFTRFPWRRALQISVNVFAAVVVLWTVQRVFFPSATFFLGDSEEQRYIVGRTPGGMVDVARSFAVSTVVTPQPRLGEAGGYPSMSVHSVPFGSGGPTEWVAIAGWLLLLGVGFRMLLRMEGLERFRYCVAGTLVGQFILHLLYGTETFLYACHFAPLLLVTAALATQTRARRLVLAVAAVTVIAVWTQNTRSFETAARTSSQHELAHSEHYERPRIPMLPGEEPRPTRPPSSRRADAARPTGSTAEATQ